MAVELDYQLEVRGLLMGPGTRFHTEPGGWGGLGVPAPKTQDVELDQAPGVYPARDYGGPRALTFPLAWGGSTAEEAMADLLELSEAWAPSVVDLELDFQLPGWGLCRVTGRPRGLAEDLARIPFGEGRALATFFVPTGEIAFVDLEGS